MNFDELYKSTILTQQNILELVDEYTLYSFYTGITPLELGRAYNSPFRKDNCPSFNVFPSTKSQTVEYMWKDHATNQSGTIFMLIMLIEGLHNLNQVYSRINEDFALGFNTTAPERREKIVWYSKPEQNTIKIRIALHSNFTGTGQAYWKQWDIDQDLLKLYCVDQVQYFWTYEGQLAPTTAPDPTFSYRIGKYYQLYSPYAKREFKHRNDLPENYFFGYIQLPPTGKVLIIDKSPKDVIFCRRLGYNAVCGKSETTMIPHSKMQELIQRFETIYIMLDNDTTGKAQTDKYLTLYPSLLPRFIPSVFAKDKTDLGVAVGLEQASSIIQNLIHGE